MLGAASAAFFLPAQGACAKCKFCTKRCLPKHHYDPYAWAELCKRSSARRLRWALARLALNVRFNHSMKSYIHDIVSRLLELHALEERLQTFPRSRDQTTDVTALIESLRSNLSVGVLLVHDRMRDKGKRSVAEIRRGVCSACHLALAIGNVATLRRGELRRCGNCGCFLYLVEEEEEQETSSVPALKRKTTKGKSPVTSDAN